MADHAQEESTEHFFTSFTDLLVGVIFLFMLLLMVFALNLKNQAPPRIVTEDIRTDIIREISTRMAARNLPVQVDFNNGIIRLPEALLFESGKWQISEGGAKTVAGLAQVLNEILPCASTSTLPCNWFQQAAKLDSILIEGHTDKRPFIDAMHNGNWELSAFRAITVYKTLTNAVPGIERGYINASGQPIIGISAYGESRPVSTADDPNRRIDVRFVMRQPGHYTNPTNAAVPTVSAAPHAAQ